MAESREIEQSFYPASDKANKHLCRKHFRNERPSNQQFHYSELLFGCQWYIKVSTPSSYTNSMCGAACDVKCEIKSFSNLFLDLSTDIVLYMNSTCTEPTME